MASPYDGVGRIPPQDDESYTETTRYRQDIPISLSELEDHSAIEQAELLWEFLQDGHSVAGLAYSLAARYADTTARGYGIRSLSRPHFKTPQERLFNALGEKTVYDTQGDTLEHLTVGALIESLDAIAGHYDMLYTVVSESNKKRLEKEEQALEERKQNRAWYRRNPTLERREEGKGPSVNVTNEFVLGEMKHRYEQLRAYLDPATADSEEYTAESAVLDAIIAENLARKLSHLPEIQQNATWRRKWNRYRCNAERITQYTKDLLYVTNEEVHAAHAEQVVPAIDDGLTWVTVQDMLEDAEPV